MYFSFTVYFCHHRLAVNSRPPLKWRKLCRFVVWVTVKLYSFSRVTAQPSQWVLDSFETCLYLWTSVHHCVMYGIVMITKHSQNTFEPYDVDRVFKIQDCVSMHHQLVMRNFPSLNRSAALLWLVTRATFITSHLCTDDLFYLAVIHEHFTEFAECWLLRILHWFVS